MSYNIGDITFTMGVHQGRRIREIAYIDFNYLRQYLAFNENCPEHDAVKSIIKGWLWIDRPIEISDELVLDAMRFAGVLAPTVTHYKNLDKIDRDIAEGRIAEWIAYYVFSDIYGDVTPPDKTVYEKKHWKPNLTCISTGQPFSVHSQNTISAKNNIESWIFSTHDPEYKGECDLKTKECFILLDCGQRIAKVRAITNLGTLHEKKMFSDPVNLGYRKDKQCIKYKDIEECDKCEL
jgi:hypothetical protein